MPHYSLIHKELTSGLVVSCSPPTPLPYPLPLPSFLCSSLFPTILSFSFLFSSLASVSLRAVVVVRGNYWCPVTQMVLFFH